ncbi:MAG: rubredoxin [Candidatus Omnitrophota bacterium]
MDKYKCTVCSYIYDPAQGDATQGVAPGTPFEKLPEGWVCPECGVGKDMFEKLQ